MNTKRCTRCKETKPVTKFTRQGRGYASMCKPCRVEAAQERVYRARFESFISLVSWPPPPNVSREVIQ